MDDRRHIIESLSAFFDCSQESIVCVYLYGSVARDEAQVGSDVDIAVLYATEPPPTLVGLGLDLGIALERQLRRPVEVLVLHHAPVDLIHRVLRDGVLLYDSDPSARIRFEVQARTVYFDLLPYLRQYRHATRSPQW